MNVLKVLILVILCAATCSAGAAALNPNQYPADLMYLGKPVDASCFSTMGHQTDDNKYDLSECSTPNSKLKITYNDYLTKKGFYGNDWKGKIENGDDYISEGYDYYKVWPAGDNHYWVLSMENGGGTGIFTTINLYTRNDFNTVSIIPIDGGDRCNGGIDLDTIKLTEHGIQYSAEVTAADFLSIKNGNPHHLQAYDDLAACAICCTAKIFYEVDQKLNLKFLYMDLDKTPKFDELPTQGKYQACFNKLQSSYIAKGKDRLDESQVTKFVEEFNRECVSAAAKT